ncbi:hypothetical protein ABW19_dt0203949 [Dactylella cylindrospora]|nr:hypothetical protein ABW19_dt0203949 [Dactylella cylindrospora]
MLPLTIKSLSILLLATAALAADPPRRTVKKIELGKRDDDIMESLKVGASCAEITGNMDDKICEVTPASVSCAPVCCMKDKMFVDGCPSGDKCVFEDEALKCCPPDEECGPRPTACADFGDSTTRGQVMCPSGTPSCITRSDGGAACTGSENSKSTSDAMTTGRRGSAPEASPTMMESSMMESSMSMPSATETMDMTDMESMSTMMEPTGSMNGSMTESMSMSESIATGSISVSGTRTLSINPTATGQGNTNAGNTGFVRHNPVFGLLVAVAVAFGIFL